MAPTRKQTKLIQNVTSRKKRRKRQREAKKQRKALFHSRSAAQRLLDEKNKEEEDSSTPSTSVKRPLEKKKSIKKSMPVKGQRSSVAEEKDKKEIVRLEKLLKINSKGSTKKLPNSFKEDGLDYVLNVVDSYSNQMMDLSEEEEEEDGSDSDSDYQIEEEELRNAEVNILKRKRRPTKQATNLATPTYGRVDGGILKSAEEERIKYETPKKVFFNLAEEEDKSGDDDIEAPSAIGGGVIGARSEEEEDEEEFQELDDSYFEIESIESIASDEEFQELDDSYFEIESIERIASEEDEEEESEEDEEMSEEEEVLPEEGEGKMAEPSMDEETTLSALTEADVSKYVPPQMREKGRAQRLTKKVQGLMNRLSESNMKSISCELECLYREASRNEMNVILWDVIEKTCAGPSLMSDKFAMEQAMMVAILHHHVGTEVGAYMVQCLALQAAGAAVDGGRLPEIRQREEGGEFVATTSSPLQLQDVGMEIRRDDPGSLKAVILQIQSKASTSELSATPRVKFMLETISALKTNNARKIPNYDPSLLEHMKKLLRGLLRSTGSLDEAQLKVSLDDLLNADKQGRWWVVGSAWTGRDTRASQSEEGVSSSLSAAKSDSVSEAWILGVARQQRMNTDLRKTLFGVMMTSEDYVDCFQKLIKLGLPDVQEREIVHVLVDCCLQEKHFNPYYAHLAQKLCEFKRAHQVTFQYSLWDRFKVLDSLTPSNLTNLRQLTFHLITKKALSLSILKVVEFTELSGDGEDTEFFKDLFYSILTELPETLVQQLFSRIAPLPNLKKLRDSLLLFIRHYLPSKKQEEGAADTSLLGQRLVLVEHVLMA